MKRIDASLTFGAVMARGPADAGGPAAAALDPAAAPAGAPEAAPAAAPAAGKWYEGETVSAEERDWLRTKGYAIDNAAEVALKAARGHRAAEGKLGRGLDAIMDKPKAGQSVSEWLAENRAQLGLPDSLDAYEAKPPEDWPKDQPWNAEMEAKARAIVFEAGAPPELHQKLVALYAGEMGRMEASATQAMEKANTEMMAALTKDWGDQADRKIVQARQAATALAERAGLDADGIRAVAGALAKDTGDAATIRMFAALGEMMGEDRAVGIGNGGGFALTPQQARAEMTRLTAPGGDMFEWVAKQAQGVPGAAAKVQELRARQEQLARIATQS
jgi:hypothetical protein